jgi:two-component system NtrC family sensor kinase
MMADGARSLARRYAVGLAGISLPLLLLIAGLAAAQFMAARAARLELIAHDIVDLRLILDALVMPMGAHVQQLRQAVPPAPSTNGRDVVVGTDRSLGPLSAFLADRHHPPGQVWVVNDQGELLAGSTEVVPKEAHPLDLADMLPPPLAARPLAELLTPRETPQRVDSWEVMTLPLTTVPWHLVFVASEQEVTALVLGRLWPYVLLLSGVLATLLLAQQLLQRFYVGPAVALASRVQEQGVGEPEGMPRVPRLWRPWFVAVDEAFRSARDHLVRAREEQALKAAVVEAAFDSIITIDETGRVLEFNEGAETTFGYPRAEAIGRPIAELIVPPHLRERHAQGLRRYLETGERKVLGRRIEVEGLWADGTRFPVELAIAEVHLGNRRLFTAYLRDITERRQAEQALRDSERQYRAVVEDQTELICRYDAEFRLTFSNWAHARLFGVEPESLLGQDLFASVPAALRGPLREALLALTPENPIHKGENEKVLSTGEVRWFAWTNHALFNEAGEQTGYQCVGRDITERKHAEAEIRRQREATHLREKLASLGSLLAGVAHELNNPLSVVVGRAIMLEEEANDLAVRVSLSRLRAAAERCARIVTSFLALAREKPRETRPVDVRNVLDAVLELAYGLRSAGVETYREDAPDLPLVLADEDELHQVFLNLLINALQALETVAPPRRLWLRTAAEDGVVRIEVADNGPGVPADLRHQVFEPFFTTKPVGAGTGLGLSVCHGIVVAHGGAITVEESPSGGACFVVTLPACPAEGDTLDPLLPTVVGAGGDILVVDDEAEVLAVLEEALARDGHRVVTAPDGAAALELLRAGQFDAVLCDLRMPGLDGLGLARELQAVHPDLAARLLLMTGDMLHAAAALPAELRGRLLEKPLDPGEVRCRVRELAADGGKVKKARPSRKRGSRRRRLINRQQDQG